MNIILVSGNLTKTRTITLNMAHLALISGAMLVTFMLFSATLNYALLRHAEQLNLPYVSRILAGVRQQQDDATRSYLRDNLNAMAVKLGEMQAQLVRLDTLGERVAKLAGFKPQDFLFDQPPGRGGAVSNMPSEDLSLGEFRRQLETVTRQIDNGGDRLGVLDSLFTQDMAKRKLLPTSVPVEGGWYSSNFGYRLDPFTGQRAFHEGIDFMAEEGTPILAAAGGVVIAAETHPQYGNMVEIDHGNELVSRYAHAARVFVKVGDVVLSGARIATVGRTGRATGTHLHFEVRQRGLPQNPAHFLRLKG
jgi:murein DD-endopeptidase MepM/ murein hydrolase activator NlpD